MWLLHLAVLCYHIECDSFGWAIVSSTFCSFRYASANGVGVCFTFFIVIFNGKEFSICCIDNAFANHIINVRDQLDCRLRLRRLRRLRRLPHPNILGRLVL